MWKRLTHPNVLPLLGISITPPQLISEWMPGGDLPKYIEKNPEVNRLGLVCLPRVVFTPLLVALLVIRRHQGPLLSPLPQCGSWGSQGSTQSVYISSHYCIYAQLAKHPCR